MNRVRIFNPFNPDDDGDITNGTAERVWFACRPSEAKDRLLEKLEPRQEQEETPQIPGIPIVGEADCTW